ncbi:MAG: protein-tyrosine-phosphatase [Microscillaceae bacterium]|nr:protein-tyrosine-phosphatase [Microscillaceae bacterium]
MKKPNFPEKLAKYCQSLESEFSQISAERKESLQELVDYLRQKLDNQALIKITVICTHNSRRSHLGQVWLKTAALYYGVANVETYSGGTDATAFNPRAVKALENVGFLIEKEDNGTNPIYWLNLDNQSVKQKMFSKKYDDSFNPQKEFCALMVCTDADEACPMVRGAEKRISMPYEDPKKFDGTDLESAKYAERCREIARDMFWVMAQLK